MNKYLKNRAFAGQVARAGESPIVAIAYKNADSESIPFGIFVTGIEKDAKKITKATDNILGVSLKMGTKAENKSGEILSVLAIPHGAEVWVQVTDAHGLAVGDDVKVEATKGKDAGKVAKAPTLSLTSAEGKFYVTGVAGSLVKLMRKE